MSHNEAFWLKVEKTEGCWIWRGGLYTAGYGLFYAGARRMLAHRFAYELACGAIGKGMFVCHTCLNRRCVRIDHLFLDSVPPFRNILRRGVSHYSAKLTDEKVLQIREMAKDVSQPEIARIFGVSRATIRNVILRISWRHI